MDTTRLNRLQSISGLADMSLSPVQFRGNIAAPRSDYEQGHASRYAPHRNPKPDPGPEVGYHRYKYNPDGAEARSYSG